MRYIQVKNVPDDVHRALSRYAKRRGRTIRDIVLEAVQRELSREEFVARLRSRSPVDLGRPAADLLREVRQERERRG